MTMRYTFTGYKASKSQKNRYKVYLLAIGLNLFCALSMAQTVSKRNHLSDHKPMMNKTWTIFDQLMYKVEKRNGKTHYTPFFPAALKALHGKEVVISGYMVPIHAGRRHHHFMLSVLPVFQCMFCGQDGIPAMVEVRVDQGKKIMFTEEPMTITGTVFLNASDENHSEIQLHQAHAQ